MAACHQKRDPCCPASGRFPEEENFGLKNIRHEQSVLWDVVYRVVELSVSRHSVLYC